MRKTYITKNLSFEVEVFEVRAGIKEFVVRTVYLSGFGNRDLNFETLKTS